MLASLIVAIYYGMLSVGMAENIPNLEMVKSNKTVRNWHPFYYELDDDHKELVKKSIPLIDAVPSKNGITFADEAAKFKFESFSQDRQDVIVLEILNHKRDGYFVDLAANHWRQYSNSMTLEYCMNWDGICIEPNKKEYLEGLLGYRRCHMYTNPVSEATGTEMTFVFAALGHGGLVGEEFDNKPEKSPQVEKVYTITLMQILAHANAPSVIDYLSLDVEGAEYHALVNFDFKKYTFLLITIERPIQKLHHLLVLKGYRFVYRITNYGECLYAHHSLPNFTEIMNKMHTVSDLTWQNNDHQFLAHPKWVGVYSE